MLGIWNVLHDPAALVSAQGSCDFVIIDLEHGSRDLTQVASALLACTVGGLEPWVRISSEADQRVQWLLDAGVENFVLPQVRDHRQVEALVDRLTFPPAGKRGTHPRRSLINQRKPPQVCIVLETPEAIEDLDSILLMNAVTTVYFGAYDLSREMGLPGGPLDPTLREVFCQVAPRVISAGKRIAAMPNDSLNVEFLSQHGTDTFLLGIDETILTQSIARLAMVHKGTRS